MDLGLHDKHAIVTGGSRGIGKAIARELAREGVDVAIVARNKADLEATARELAAGRTGASFPLQPMSLTRSRWTAWSPRRHSSWVVCTSWSTADPRRGVRPPRPARSKPSSMRI